MTPNELKPFVARVIRARAKRADLVRELEAADLELSVARQELDDAMVTFVRVDLRMEGYA